MHLDQYSHTSMQCCFYFGINRRGIQCAHMCEMCKWSCKIVCTLSNEIEYLCKLSDGEMWIGGDQRASYVDCFFAKCSNRCARTAFQFKAPLTNQNLECRRKHVDFFIQASLYTFFNSQYDSNSFLFDLI